MKENGRWKAFWVIDKFNDSNNRLSKILKKGVSIKDLVALVDPSLYIGQEKMKGNLLLNTGIDEIWNLIVGDSVNHFAFANCKIGVGNDNTAAQATDTDLVGGSTAYVTMDATYPTSSSQAVNFRATFGSGVGTFAWEEFVIKQDTSSICLNRKVESKGTKSSGETWVITLTITLS